MASNFLSESAQMRLLSSATGFNQQSPEGEQRCLNSELWHACAGPLVSLPSVASRVVYFPQGHSEQVAASTNKEVDHIPNVPNLPPQLICQLHNVTMHADVETDEVYAQMTLQPLSPQEQKEASFLPEDLGSPSKQPTNYFCKTLTASDTSTHGGFSVPRRAAEKVFPPLDFSQQPPAQELIARDLHDNEWKFRHIFRGQPKRHLLTTGWSVFVSAKRLVAGDSVLFIWNEKNQLLLGFRRANRPQTVMPSVLSSDSMHLGLLAAAAHAAATNSRFTIFYNPRASPSEFVIPLARYIKAVYHTRVSVGMRFRMLFETEESTVRRYMGTITGVSDFDPVRWLNSHWRSVKVGWDESTTGERQPRVSLWEIEPLTTFPMYPSPFSLRLKRPWYPGLPSFNGMKDDMVMNSPVMWFRGDVAGDCALHCLNFQGLGMSPWMQPRVDATMLGMQNELYQAMAASAAMQETKPVVEPSKQTFSPFLQLQQCQGVACSPASLVQNQVSEESQSQSQSQPTFLQSIPEAQAQLQIPNHSQSLLLQQQLQQQHQNSFNNLQQSPEQQQLNDHQQVSGVIPFLSQFTSGCQVQSPSLQTLSTIQQPNFADSEGSHITSSVMSPLHSLVGSITQDETSHVLNVPSSRSSTMLSPTGWPPKRMAVDKVLSSVGSQSISSHVSHSNPITSPNTSVSLPPFPGRGECSIDQEGTVDPQNNLLFGVNIDSSSSLIMQNGISNLRGGIVSDKDATTVHFGSSNYVTNTTDMDFLPNPTMTPSGCIDESGFLQSSESIGQANQPTRTFVKVYKSGSFGRSLDLTKFSSYHELRSELARMFGLEGHLEDPLRSGWQLVFVDRENDVLLLGDDPWPEFVSSVWCIKILSPQEVQQHMEGKQGLELLNSVNPATSSSSTRKQNGSCDDYACCRNPSGRRSRITSSSVCSFDY